MGQVIHALLTRPPLRITTSTRRLQKQFSVRLACVKHAASVHPEPGSNSQKMCLFQVQHKLTSLYIPFYCFKGSFDRSLNVSVFPDCLYQRIFEDCIYVFHCSVIKVLIRCSLETACLLYHSCLSLSRTFLKFFLFFFRSSFATASLIYHIDHSMSTLIFIFFRTFQIRIFQKIRTEKEGFEPSHRANGLYP